MNTVHATKVCATCAVGKPPEAFHLCSAFADGRYNRCAECRNAARRLASDATPRMAQRTAKAELLARGVKLCRSCGEVKGVAGFFRNRTQADGRGCMCKECDQARYLARPLDERNARHKAWREANPEAWAAMCRKATSTRRARLRNAFVESVDPRVSFEMHGGMCGICEQFIDGSFDVDHIVPLALGGEHSYANTQPAHPSCNRAKGRAVALAGKEI